ncbi:sugar nucleotide-binding protein [Flavobacteriaceae bacterium]|nr:sugar nucleotide-binding protein [Flavobacteriaceae bacterium]
MDKFSTIKDLQIQTIDIFNENVVKNLVKDYDVIINLIGKLFEAKKGDFSKFHHKFPECLSKTISDKQHLIHVSALGIEDSCKTSIYAQTKLDGQKAIIKNSKNYNIMKPSIVFGKNDNFFNLFAKISKTSPFLPLIGGGKAKFAPIYVEDLAKSIVLLAEDGKKYKNKIFESYGHDSSSFKELMQFIIKTTGRKRFLIKLPFFIAKIQARLLNLFKIYLLTSDQVELLKYDNIASNKHDNIDKIIGNLKSFKKIVPKYLS